MNNQVDYSKQDAKMTQGLAILSMVCLHLFCREVTDFLGKPLIWINSTTPFLYWIGFFSEICVPIYSMCAGYAYELMHKKEHSSFKYRRKRVINLLINYWCILILFVLIGIVKKDARIPGSFLDFLGNIILITRYTYNGTWWYLATYIIIQMLPVAILVRVPEKLSLPMGLLFFLGLDALKYFVFKFSLLPEGITTFFPFDFIYSQLLNLWRVLPFFWIGILFCHHNTFEKIDIWLSGKTGKNQQKNAIVLFCLIILFFIANILHKSVLMGGAAVGVFLLFNLIDKTPKIKKVFAFLGEHSTNIWLSHMFFITIFFDGFADRLKYSIVVFICIMALCIIVSYTEKAFEYMTRKLCASVQNK